MLISNVTLRVSITVTISVMTVTVTVTPPPLADIISWLGRNFHQLNGIPSDLQQMLVSV